MIRRDWYYRDPAPETQVIKIEHIFLGLVILGIGTVIASLSFAVELWIGKSKNLLFINTIRPND